MLAVPTLCRQSRSKCLVQSIDLNIKSIVAIFNVRIIRFEALTLPWMKFVCQEVNERKSLNFRKDIKAEVIFEFSRKNCVFIGIN